MREAVGGSMLMYIVIPIIILFIVFIAFIMKYASYYRASNYLITQIETCEANMNNCEHTSREKMENDIVNKYHYRDTVNYSCTDNARGSVYSVALKINFDLPLIGKIGVYEIKSETKTIYNISCSDSTGLTF